MLLRFPWSDATRSENSASRLPSLHVIFEWHLCGEQFNVI